MFHSTLNPKIINSVFSNCSVRDIVINGYIKVCTVKFKSDIFPVVLVNKDINLLKRLSTDTAINKVKLYRNA